MSTDIIERCILVCMCAKSLRNNRKNERMIFSSTSWLCFTELHKYFSLVLFTKEIHDHRKACRTA